MVLNKFQNLEKRLNQSIGKLRITSIIQMCNKNSSNPFKIMKQMVTSGITGSAIYVDYFHCSEHIGKPPYLKYQI